MKKTMLLIMMIIALLCGCSKQNMQSLNTFSESVSNKLVGAWKSYGDVSEVFIFDENGNWQGLISHSDSIIDHTVAGKYEYKDNKLILKQDYEADIILDITFMNSDTILMSSENTTLNFLRCTPSTTHSGSLVGSWKPVFSKDIKLDTGCVWFNSEIITFFTDGTYRSTSEEKTSNGRYELVFDGDAVRIIQSNDTGILDFDLLGHGLMLLECKLYDNSQLYYLLESCE